MIAVTLVCCYAACWGPTKRKGVYHVLEHATGVYRNDAESTQSEWGYAAREHPPNEFLSCLMPEATLPLVVRVEGSDATRRYYFWFFGYVAKLPL